MNTHIRIPLTPGRLPMVGFHLLFVHSSPFSHSLRMGESFWAARTQLPSRTRLWRLSGLPFYLFQYIPPVSSLFLIPTVRRSLSQFSPETFFVNSPTPHPFEPAFLAGAFHNGISSLELRRASPRRKRTPDMSRFSSRPFSPREDRDL